VGRVAVNMTAGALAFPRRRFVGLTALAAASWAVYSTVIGIGAGAWLQGRPVVAVVVGVIAGTMIGLAVDWVLGRVQRRPHLRWLAQRRGAQRRAAQRRLAQRRAAQGRIARMRRVRVGSRRREAPAPGRPAATAAVPVAPMVPIVPLVDDDADLTPVPTGAAPGSA
jgi:membrane-associated protein